MVIVKMVAKVKPGDRKSSQRRLFWRKCGPSTRSFGLDERSLETEKFIHNKPVSANSATR